MDKTDVIPIKLNVKNYLQWSSHLVNFVEGHGLLGILDGTDSMPTISKSKEQESVSTADLLQNLPMKRHSLLGDRTML